MSEVLTKQLWLQAFQKKQYDKFIARGIPTRKEENWKYTQVPALPEIESELASVDNETLLLKASSLAAHKIVFINGEYSATHSSIKNLPEGITLSPLSFALHHFEKTLKPYLTNEFDVQRYPFATLNSAKMSEGVFLQIAKNVKVDLPVHIIYFTNKDHLILPRNLVVLDEGSDVTLIEEYISDSTTHFTNAVTELHVGENSKLDFYKIQDESKTASHIASLFVNQHKDSRVNMFTFSKGAQVSREDVFVGLTAKAAECSLLGLYTLHHDGQHCDHHLHVDHAAEHGTSSMLYKGILDKKTKAVFNGKVYVHPNSQHTNSYQANHNLLLSQDAEVNTKPELEIYADDVKCTHGATVGQLDSESLFYLRSRGMDKDAALRMLLIAFADEVISKIKSPEIKAYIQTRVENYVEL